MKTFLTFVVGLLIGAAAGGGYMYTQLQDAVTRIAGAEVAREAAIKVGKDLEEKVRSVQSKGEAALKQARDQLDELRSGKQAAEDALSKSRNDLASSASA